MKLQILVEKFLLLSKYHNKNSTEKTFGSVAAMTEEKINKTQTSLEFPFHNNFEKY